MGVPPIAHGYNAPARESDLEASFGDIATAQAYADAYGGEVEARGTAFVVGYGADHRRAQDDLAEAQRAVPQDAPAVPDDLDERIQRAIEADRARRDDDRFEREPVEPIDPAAPPAPSPVVERTDADGETPANPS